MDEQEHKKRHIILYQCLDELVADFIRHTENLPSQTTLMDFMKWSSEQAKKPTELESK